MGLLAHPTSCYVQKLGATKNRAHWRSEEKFFVSVSKRMTAAMEEFRIQMGLDSNLSLPRQRYMGQIRRLKFEFKPLDVLEKNTHAFFFRSELLRLRS